MKQKSIKITQNTLFIYKSVKRFNGRFNKETTDPTTATTLTTTTSTGIFQK